MLARKPINLMEQFRDEDGCYLAVEVMVQENTFHVASVYAPNETGERSGCWKFLNDRLSGDRWLLGGDWNMVEAPTDRSHPGKDLSVSEAEAWESLALGNSELAELTAFMPPMKIGGCVLP